MPTVTTLEISAAELQLGDVFDLAEHSVRVLSIVKRTSRSIEIKSEQTTADGTAIVVHALPLTRKLHVTRSTPTTAERAESMRAVLASRIETIVAEARSTRDDLRAEMIEKLTAANDLSDALAWSTEGWMQRAEASKLAVRLAATLSLSDTMPAQIAAIRRHVSMCQDELNRWTPAQSSSAVRNVQSTAVHHALQEVVTRGRFEWLLALCDEYETLLDAVIAENIAHESGG